MATRTFHYFLDGISQDILSEAETRELLGATIQPDKPVVNTDPPVKEPPVTTPPVTTPPVVDTKPLPVYGYPRRQVGTKTIDDKGERTTYPVLAFTGVDYIGLQISDKPDIIVFKGTDWEYDLLPGATRPVGSPSEWYGNTEPEGAIQPEGYEKLFFDNDPKQPYYRQITGYKPGSDYVVR